MLTGPYLWTIGRSNGFLFLFFMENILLLVIIYYYYYCSTGILHYRISVLTISA